MLQFRASYDLFLMPPPPPPSAASGSSAVNFPFLPSLRCLYLSASLTVTLSAASGMQSGSEEGRGEGQKRDKYVILVYGFGMTQHSPLFLVQQRKCEALPIRTLLMVNTLRRWRRRRIHNRPPSRQANITSR